MTPLHQPLTRSWKPVLCVLAGLLAGSAAAAEPGFIQPGAVYREFALHSGGNRDWRVTDPDATARGAHEFLPNPVLRLEVDDLQHAVRAEAMLHRWGGHVGTSNKQIRFNDNDWLTVPELTTTPPGTRPEEHYFEDNPVVEVPLAHLQEGTNTLEGTCSALSGHNWGQWGLYSLILRVYYAPDEKSHPKGAITSPRSGAMLTESPTIEVNASAHEGVARIDVLAYYMGYDEDGDGHFRDWHATFFQPLRGTAADLREHVGTAWREPYCVTWDTQWVPDQREPVQLVARIQDSRGVWFVTDIVEEVSLRRTGVSVVLYRAVDVPERFGVRVGQTKSCRMVIPDDVDLSQATDAVLALRTWHGWDGHHELLDLNGHRLPIRGKNHHHDYDLLTVPASALRAGDNVLTIRSQTEHHMLEVHWPGPALLVRYNGSP